MLFISSARRRKSKEVASPELVQRIGLMDTYGGADHAEVERRLRSMSYGATNSRITKLRERTAACQPATSPATSHAPLLGAGWMYDARRLDPAI